MSEIEWDIVTSVKNEKYKKNSQCDWSKFNPQKPKCLLQFVQDGPRRLKILVTYQESVVGSLIQATGLVRFEEGLRMEPP